ncbi:MAG: hypothetical protein ACOCT9_02185 [archaeon]
MAFLHCHNCGWSQDDFWDEDYNPLSNLTGKNEKDLLNKDLDKVVYQNNQGKKITLRKHITNQLSKSINKINKMKYRTREEFEKKNPEKKCPRCHKKSLDID